MVENKYLFSNTKNKFQAVTITELIKVESAELIYGDYKFVRRFRNVNLVSNEYLNSVLKRALKNSFCLDTSKVTEDELSVAIKYTDKMSLKGKALENFKTVISSIVDSDFFVESVILKAEQDVFDNLSNGLNATLYFDIISHDKQKGIYIVDQPEDDVSQPAIKSNLISDFKKMSSIRQVILITHNAQFVVNLDVDNVICLSKNKNKGIEIKYGALEYEDANMKFFVT